MTEEHDRAQEGHLRDVDRVLLYISQAQAQAQVKAEEMADALAKDGVEERLIAALRTAAGAMSAEHTRLMTWCAQALRGLGLRDLGDVLHAVLDKPLHDR